MPLFMDAWLKLAAVRAASGRTSEALSILRFSDKLTHDVVKWKWPQILLSLDLGDNDVFLRNANFLLNHNQLTNDSLQLLDMHYEKNSDEVIKVLEPENLARYLQWLMKWKRTEDSFLVWNSMSSHQKQVDQLYEKYVDFLINGKEVRKAAEIWVEFSGSKGITNQEFDYPISNRGFGWRSLSDNEKKWNTEIVRTDNVNKAVRISFFGKDNLNFYHFYQIVPVTPLQSYRLSYRWSGKNITTDQRPFVEISGFDCKGLALQSEMIPSSSGWKQESLEWVVPENCNAIVVRVRRNKSRRFDSKIEGELWLDGFRLEKVGQL